MTTGTIFNGQSIVLNVQSGHSVAVVAVSGTYSASITAGAEIGVIATEATGGTYGPYANGVVINLAASALSEIDFAVAETPVIVSDTVVFATIDPATGAQGVALLGTPTSGVLTNATGLPTTGLVDLAVTTAKIADLGVTTAKIADLGVTTAKIEDAAITQAQVKTKTVVALADADATLTAAQMIDSGIFTITPTVARTLTTDTAANIVAALPRYQVGTWFDIVIVNTDAFDVTLAAGTGITLVGKMIINNVSGVWKARIDSATAVTIYRL